MPPSGLCAQLACIWGSTAACPGNVHRYRDFADLTYVDCLASAAAIAPILAEVAQRGVGAAVLAGVEATRQVVAANPNLGVLLLLAPLAAVPPERHLHQGISDVLQTLDVNDSRAVYQAIRLAAPAGLGQVPEQDVADVPTLPLREVMALAADRDRVARQYACDFADVFEVGLPALASALHQEKGLEDAIVQCHLTLMARFPDSLIARKRGLAEAEEAARQAQRVLDGSLDVDGLERWFDEVPRGRNPGTTADLVTASLFVALREGMIRLPPEVPWSQRK